MRSLLTIAQAADILNVSTKTVRVHINAGRLFVVALGESSRGDMVKPSELERFIEDQTIQRVSAKCRSTLEGKRVSTGASSNTTGKKLDALLGKPAREKLKSSSVG